MLNDLTTEQRNPDSEAIDALSTWDIVTLMNREDARVATAVQTQIPAIADAVDVIVRQIARDGRLFYLGAGTSGRLGVLDAAECPPTFNTPPELVVGIIAGGTAALTRAVEGAEDHPDIAQRDLEACTLTSRDVVIGIATSGRTPYVLGGLAYARRVGAYTIGLSCNPDSELTQIAQLMISPVVGPEVISGSTRLKAGTATKLVLNMLTTASMIRLGKTYGNLMVDLRATNTKLLARARRIVANLAQVSESEADGILRGSGGEVKTAVVMQRHGLTAEQARQWLQDTGGHLRAALERPFAPQGDDEAGPRPAAGPGRHGALTPASWSQTADQEPSATAPRSTLLIGMDGGGTQTRAVLAVHQPGQTPKWIGCGTSGPSNPHTAGWSTAVANIQQALARAFEAAEQPRRRVAAICLGVAGTGREPVRRHLQQWCEQSGVADRCHVVHDAQIILRAGVPHGPGVALIGGTGSLAYGVDAAGGTARAGGWGPLLSDEGSGYAMGRAALRAVVRAADGRGEETVLTSVVLAHLGLSHPRDLIATTTDHPDLRLRVAALAPLVLAAADRGDATAMRIQAQAAADLAGLISAVARTLACAAGQYRLAFAGGLLRHHPHLRDAIAHQLAVQHRLSPESTSLVDEPVQGAVMLADDLLS